MAGSAPAGVRPCLHSASKDAHIRSSALVPTVAAGGGGEASAPEGASVCPSSSVAAWASTSDHAAAHRPRSGYLPWRRLVASLNVLVTSTCWRNVNNGGARRRPGRSD